ncbi:DUF4810 domain-containing protein [Pokkaliibacter sp. MBI-7]|uniref:DUF4810 domain-containing protein n=1 Tax=Pokkaliibacter sp. MBI-7 TaxID=3040600 RepID=UPI00244A12B2|nr:DUF4810 domain-containing protein [Pokkaliibacter sp. MBI-7]MDH2432401.1 DUF4810 domain-containing protein [Pokkaliibacter sp. MBI-7]
MKKTARSAALCLTLLMAGCASQPKTLYYWGDYSASVDAYIMNEGGDVDQQIALLEQTEVKAKTGNAKTPPGFYAQLGLLMVNKGDLDKARVAFESEKEHFPESATYMDFLLKNL